MFDINKASLSNLIEKGKFETSTSKIQKNLNCELVVLPTLKPYIDKAWTWLQSQETMYANEEHTLAEVLSEFVCADALAAIITDKVKCYDDEKNSPPRSSLSDYAIWLFGQPDLNLLNRANVYPHIRKLHTYSEKRHDITVLGWKKTLCELVTCYIIMQTNQVFIGRQFYRYCMIIHGLFMH